MCFFLIIANCELEFSGKRIIDVVDYALFGPKLRKTGIWKRNMFDWQS